MKRIVLTKRIGLKRLILLLLGGHPLLYVSPPPAWGQGTESDPAARRIRAFYDTLLDVMKQAQRLGIQGRYDRLAPVIRSTFDFAAMRVIAVGHDWSAIDPDIQAQLMENFARMTIATYANRFDGYASERFDVDQTSEARNTGRIVRTRLVAADGEVVSLNYLMRGSGDTWKIVDIYLTGTISELATRRTEFAAILKTGGPRALVESLGQQADKEMRAGESKAGASKS